jgi:hypothetical protein
MPAQIKYNVEGHYFSLLNTNCCPPSSGSTDLKSTDISPVYTSEAEAEANLLNYKIIRVDGSTVTNIDLPPFQENLHIRILNISFSNVYISYSGRTTLIGKELMSFFCIGTEWIYFNGF